ncbi:flavin-containing monooxygenase/FMO family protein [Ceratobasidium sp. AG-Ba]|nr:flavin-containing monooxygenase/FMO family protein [Ceratobasidium sp. AG-Ba]
MRKQDNTPSIAIIGSGVGGLLAAISLQVKLGFYNYTIYELAGELGGTWQQNTYPGCACDVPAHWYSLSFDPNPDWSCVYVAYKEIHQYWKRLASKYDLVRHIQYRTEVISAVWDEEKQFYRLQLRNTETQEIREEIANIVISATGAFNHPKWPNIPGRESFQGASIHAKMWDHSVDFNGKRVALIGNGCAGSQIFPALATNPSTHVINFCRSKSWYIPRPQKQVYDWVKWSFRNIPLTLKAFRYFLAGTYDVTSHNWKVGPITNYLRRSFEKVSIEHINTTAPEKYRKTLIPDYPIGCKRIVFDPGYVEALNQENVEIEFDPITEIVSDGIVTKSGKKYDVDIICYATGFDVEGSYRLNVKGINGQSMQEYFESEGGASGYMGTTAPGFPNWITLFGPNLASGHASVICVEEIQMNYAMQFIKPIIQGKAKSFVPKLDTTRAWNDWVQSCLKGYIWTSCTSWYRSAGTGKVVAVWPGSLVHLWWSFRHPVWANFNTVGGEKWLRNQKIIEFIKTSLQVGVVGAGVGLFIASRAGMRTDIQSISHSVAVAALSGYHKAASAFVV